MDTWIIRAYVGNTPVYLSEDDEWVTDINDAQPRGPYNTSFEEWEQLAIARAPRTEGIRNIEVIPGPYIEFVEVVKVPEH